MNTDIAHTVYCTYIKCKTFTNQLHIKRNNEPTMYAHTATVYAVTITKLINQEINFVKRRAKNSNLSLLMLLAEAQFWKILKLLRGSDRVHGLFTLELLNSELQNLVLLKIFKQTDAQS